jgi:uncharacterized membrane protein
VSLYEVLKFAHVLLAIVAVGFNASYGVWLARVAREPAPTQSFVLRGIKRLDDWFANPAYLLLAVTGVAMVLVGGLRFTVFWIAGGIVLWAIAVGLGFFVYTPMLRGQIRALETSGPESDEYARHASNARFMGIVLAIIVVAIVFLMVTKPDLAR